MSVLYPIINAWSRISDGTLTLGNGANPAELAAFIELYPAAGSDLGWLDFQRRYGGATLEMPPHQLAILGFDDDISPDLRYAEGDVVSADGLLDFAVLSLEFPRNEAPPEGRFLDVGFTFDTRTMYGGGVLARRREAPVHFADSFLDWIQRIHDGVEDLARYAR